MAGLGIRLYIDEDVEQSLAGELRKRGYDAESCVEAGRNNRGISDEAQLAYAAQQGRAILVYNSRDSFPLATEWSNRGRQYAGIIVSVQIIDPGELLRRVMHHLDTTDPAWQVNNILWLR